MPFSIEVKDLNHPLNAMTLCDELNKIISKHYPDSVDDFFCHLISDDEVRVHYKFCGAIRISFETSRELNFQYPLNADMELFHICNVLISHFRKWHGGEHETKEIELLQHLVPHDIYD